MKKKFPGIFLKFRIEVMADYLLHVFKSEEGWSTWDTLSSRLLSTSGADKINQNTASTTSH